MKTITVKNVGATTTTINAGEIAGGVFVETTIDKEIVFQHRGASQKTVNTATSSTFIPNATVEDVEVLFGVKKKKEADVEEPIKKEDATDKKEDATNDSPVNDTPADEKETPTEEKDAPTEEKEKPATKTKTRTKSDK